jgi:hypothetical protein
MPFTNELGNHDGDPHQPELPEGQFEGTICCQSFRSSLAPCHVIKKLSPSYNKMMKFSAERLYFFPTAVLTRSCPTRSIPGIRTYDFHQFVVVAIVDGYFNKGRAAHIKGLLQDPPR